MLWSEVLFVICNADIIENEVIGSKDRCLLEKSNTMEVEKNNLLDENKVHLSTICDMQVSIDEGKILRYMHKFWAQM